MSTYLEHRIYHRRLTTAELGDALEHGNGLLLVDTEGQPKYIDNPLGMARRPKEEMRQLWQDACAEGRVYLVWASRWMPSDELPAVAPLTVSTEQPAEA